MMSKKLGRYFFAMMLGLVVNLPLTASQAATVASSPLFSTFDNKPAKIADYIGNKKWLLVMIWASDCHICNREAYTYVDFNFKHEDRDARVLGISIDGQAKKKAAELFIKRHDINFPNLIAEPDRLADWFEKLTGQNWMGTPTLLLYSPDGELRVQQIGAIPLELVEKFIQHDSARKISAVEKVNQGS
ncbi:MAG: TlpA family protein disulfide reductase [Gammaproteobacteria bacterium]|nr:TlpA family protein disulfide reductase [Gammaproteobacteria bacterium]